MVGIGPNKKKKVKVYLKKLNEIKKKVNYGRIIDHWATPLVFLLCFSGCCL